MDEDVAAKKVEANKIGKAFKQQLSLSLSLCVPSLLPFSFCPSFFSLTHSGLYVIVQHINLGKRFVKHIVVLLM